MTAPRPDADLDRALLADLQAELRREDRGWRRIRSWSTPSRRGLVVAMLVALEVVILLGMPRTDLDAVPALRLVAGGGALLGAALVGITLFLRPMHRRGLRVGVNVAAGLAILALPFAFALLPAPHAAHAAHPESFLGTGDDFVPRMLGCLVFGSILAAALTAVLVVVDRRGSLAGWRIALVAGAGGAAGTLGLLLHCPLVSLSHRIASHGPVGLLTAFLLASALLLVRRRRKPASTP